MVVIVDKVATVNPFSNLQKNGACHGTSTFKLNLLRTSRCQQTKKDIEDAMRTIRYCNLNLLKTPTSKAEIKPAT
jgi:hypothetical protein